MGRPLPITLEPEARIIMKLTNFDNLKTEVEAVPTLMQGGTVRVTGTTGNFKVMNTRYCKECACILPNYREWTDTCSAHCSLIFDQNASTAQLKAKIIELESKLEQTESDRKALLKELMSNSDKLRAVAGSIEANLKK